MEFLKLTDAMNEDPIFVMPDQIAEISRAEATLRENREIPERTIIVTRQGRYLLAKETPEEVALMSGQGYVDVECLPDLERNTYQTLRVR